jgi:hypothetical protein
MENSGLDEVGRAESRTRRVSGRKTPDSMNAARYKSLTGHKPRDAATRDEPASHEPGAFPADRAIDRIGHCLQCC